MERISVPSPSKKSWGRAPTSIQSLDDDIICIIFSYLGLFDVVRCSVVCKSWNAFILRSKLLQELCSKKRTSRIDWSEESLNTCLEELAMEHHRSSLLKGPVFVDQWKGHSYRAEQCRVKMGLILSGVGDKVMRLWSLDSYNCVGEYAIPNGASLYDFDFDESKIVGLVGTQICIWRRNGRRNLFPERESTFNKGLCMRYFDPDAVVGCEDGTARVFDMYSKRCSQIIRMHSEAVTRICFSEDQLVLCGSSLGRITVSSLSSDHRVATLRATDYKGIKALCFNPSSRLVFAGTTAGCTSCWDLRTMRRLWERRVSPNVVYAMQHLHHDVSTLVVGGLDGILRVQDQNTGEVLSSYVLDYNTSCVDRGRVMIERASGRKLSKYEDIDKIHRRYRPPITSLAVGMKKVITTHNSKFIRVWKFE